MKELTEKEALYKAAAYCSSAEHCPQEIEKKLTSWGLDNDAIARIIAYLTKEKYIDIQRFCQCFVREKLTYNKWGRIKIAQALWSKQIPTAISAPILDAIPTEEYENILLHLIEEKQKSTTGRNEFERKGKIIRYALGKGFEMEIILKIIQQPEQE